MHIDKPSIANYEMLFHNGQMNKLILLFIVTSLLSLSVFANKKDIINVHNKRLEGGVSGGGMEEDEGYLISSLVEGFRYKYDYELSEEQLEGLLDDLKSLSIKERTWLLKRLKNAKGPL